MAAIRLQTGIVSQLVKKSTGADLHATKMLIDTLKDGREKRAVWHRSPSPPCFTAGDEEVMATFVTRLRQAWAEELKERGTESALAACRT